MSKLQTKQLFKAMVMILTMLICGKILFIQRNCNSVNLSNDLLNISGLKLNETGFGFNIVPNIVHYVLFTVHEIEFSHFISFLSVLKNQKPEKVYIHCDCSQLSGDYYQRVLRVANKTNTSIIIRTIERPTQIFGKSLSKESLNWHSSDITRIRVLQEFGGIYLDRDVYVVQSLDVFRKFEMTVDWDEGHHIETQIVLAYKHARFLNLWFDSFHNYHSNLWYFNGGIYPTDKYLNKNPELVHRVTDEFEANPRLCKLVYTEYYPKWRDYYAIHLLIRGNEIAIRNWCFNHDIPAGTVYQFDDEIAPKLNVTFGEMTRTLYEYENNLK